MDENEKAAAIEVLFDHFRDHALGVSRDYKRTRKGLKRVLKDDMQAPEDILEWTGDDFTMAGLNYLAVSKVVSEERRLGTNLVFDDSFVIDHIKPKEWSQQPSSIPGDEFTLTFGDKLIYDKPFHPTFKSSGPDHPTQDRPVSPWGNVRNNMPPPARVELGEIETDLQYFRAHGVLPALGETQFDEELDDERNHRHQLAVDNAVLRARLGYRGRHIIEGENEPAPEPEPMIDAAAILEVSYQITSGISQVSPSLLLATIFLVERD
ncbi:hypothetical protein PG987_015528 [Apiospora arundinis]